MAGGSTPASHPARSASVGRGVVPTSAVRCRASCPSGTVGTSWLRPTGGCGAEDESWPAATAGPASAAVTATEVATPRRGERRGVITPRSIRQGAREPCRAHDGGMVDVDEETFGRLVEEALDSIPPELGRVMRNVAVLLEDYGGSPTVLGLYQGVPLTARTSSYGGVLPDRITIYRLPLCRRARDLEDVVQQVRHTVIHEVAHHFGISDERLEELGAY